MTRQWTSYDSGERVLDALSTWLEKHDRWQYRLKYHPDYLEKKWEAQVFTTHGEGELSVNGRGDTAHEATVEMFLLADVQRLPATPTLVLFLNPREAKLLKEVGFPNQLMAVTPDLLKEE